MKSKEVIAWKNISFYYFFIFSYFSFGKNYIAEISKVYSNDNLVIGTTSRLKFSSEVSIIKENGNIQDFFQLETNSNNSFINLAELKITNISGTKVGNKIYFKNTTNGEGLQEIKILVEGEFVFNWLNQSREKENIKIGYINSSINPVYLNLDTKELKPIHSLKIKVLNNMNLGKGVAGEKLSTKESGEPANLSIEGEENKSINIYIPSSTTIKNSNNDTLTVNIRFRDNNSQELIRRLSSNSKNTYRVGNDGRVITKDILIDGETQTKKTSRGVYRGFFTVKVEYLD